MSVRILAPLLALLLFLGCASTSVPQGTERPTRTPAPPTRTATKTPEPASAGVCAYAHHPEAQNRNGTTPLSNDPVIKAIVNEAGNKIYLVPGMRRYSVIKVEEDKGGRWFCKESEAERAGWRASASLRESPTPAATVTPDHRRGPELPPFNPTPVPQ